MDKSKSRTDLLAAGRKKLQQFRQKKDGKGSGSSNQGKSSKKGGKVEKHDARADSISSDDRSAESTHLIEEGIGQRDVDSSLSNVGSSLSNVDSSVSLSVDDVTPETDGSKADESSVLHRHEIDADKYDGACEPDLPVDEADPGSLKPLATTESMPSEVDSVHAHQFLSPDRGGQDTDANSLHPEHDHPNITLIGTSEGQMVDASFSEVVLKYESTEEPPMMLVVDTVNPNIQVDATETNIEAEEKVTSSSFADTAVTDGDDVEAKDDHPTNEIFTQVMEDKLVDAGTTIEFVHKTEFPLESDGSTPDESASTKEHEAEACDLRNPYVTKTSPPEHETTQSISPSPKSGESSAVTVDVDALDIKTEDIFLQQTVTDLSLVQAREDQVTDLGPMQEADLLGPEQLVSSSDINIKEDPRNREIASLVGSIPVLDTNNNGIPDSVTDSNGISLATAEVCGLTSRNINILDDGSTQMPSDASDIGRLEGLQGEATSQAGDMGFSIDQDNKSRLLQLANYVKELNESEFEFLKKLRNSDVQVVSSDTDISVQPSHSIADILDTYKDQIYVANVSKDILSVQLVEQSNLILDEESMRQQWNDKISKLEISLETCEERNKTLDEELVLCRSELQNTVKKNEELFSSVHEWKDKYYRSQEDSSIISKDLFDRRCLVDTLQTEKESLSESLKLMVYERKKCIEEKDNMFKETERLLLEIGELKSQLADVQSENASLTDKFHIVADDERKLIDERERLVQENTVISFELAHCKTLIADAQAKCASASQSIFILTEERDKLLSQTHDYKDDYDKMTTELIEYKNHVANLEAEKSKLSLSLSSAADERKKLEEENRCLSHEYEILSSENRVIQEALLSASAEKINLEADKNNVDLWLEQLIEENIFLHSSFEVLQSKIREIRDEASQGSNEIRLFVNKIDERSFVVSPSSNGCPTTLLPHYSFNSDNDALHTAMLEHAVSMERFTIELQVQNEVLKENLPRAEKLQNCQSRVTDMLNQLLEMKHNLGEVAPSILNQLRDMQTQIAEEVSRFDKQCNSIVTQIVSSVMKLNSFSSGLLVSAERPDTQDFMEIANLVSTSVDSAMNFIQRLQDDVESLKSEYQSLDCSYKELHGSYTRLCEEKATSFDMLHKVHDSLRSLVIASCRDENEIALDFELKRLIGPSEISDYMMLIEQLSNSLNEKVQLKSENAKLLSELDYRGKEMEEFKNTSYLDMHVITELVEHVERELRLATLETDSGFPLISRLENCINFLLQAHKEAEKKDNFFTDTQEVVEKPEGQMEKDLEQLKLLYMQQENEIKSLRQSLSNAEEQLIGVKSELQKKVAEVEQSEQRVSSIREKLSIAVAKGKGLIVQRDNLKQSLAETSSELEKTRQQLQLSDSMLLEAETKLKTYAEAGERVEALESELSYIRNSATALRESFLLKDSVLQRIEEILENLELPEHLLSQEIIDKVDWLARSVVGNSNALPATDWDQKNSPEGGSYTDNEFVVMDALRDDTQHSSRASDDLRRKHEELQNKFYGLAEQNEMLEQSLMERNSMVQRLEEVLDKINMPAHLRSMEAESRIEWLSGALSDALLHASTLQERLDNLNTRCEKLLAELEESQRSSSDTKLVLESTIKEKESLLSTLADISHNVENSQERVASLELENNKLQIEIDDLQEKLLKNKAYSDEVESGIWRMLDLISTALQDPGLKELTSVDCNISHLEEILRRLIDDHIRLSEAVKIPREVFDSFAALAVSTRGELGELTSSDHDSIVNTLKKELEDALSDLTEVKEERDIYMEKHKSQNKETEDLYKRVEELENLLNQEEQKSTSLREKLNVAVRKGKSLVQQRDSLKQTIEEMNIRVDNLTLEINNHQSTIAWYEEKCKELSLYAEKAHASESENQLVRNQLTETEHYLQEERRAMSLILNEFNHIKLNGGFTSSDPVDMLQQLGKAYHYLLEAKASSDQESMKSKRAAELLLAELNEVQERNDSLQDELAKAADEVSELSKAKLILEAARSEAFSQLSKLSAAQKEEQTKLNARLIELVSSVDQLRKYFEDTIHILADMFSMDMDFFKSLELCLNASDTMDLHGEMLLTEPDGNQRKFMDNGIPAWEKFIASDSWLTSKTQEQINGNDMDGIYRYIEDQVRDFASKVANAKEKLQRYLILKDQEATRVSTNLKSIQQKIVSRIMSLEKEREIERSALLKNIALLYGACTDSIQEVGNRKTELSRDNPSAIDMGMTVTSAETGEDIFLSEAHIRALSEKLLAVVKDLSNTEKEIGKADHLEMKNTIVNLQKEIQEKDIQKERICMEFVGQIKRAEAAAANKACDLELTSARVYDLEMQISAIGMEKNLLEQKLKEMEDVKKESVELQERIRSITDLLSSKDQEIESLMQALDEEETELEEMRKKVEQIETELLQKNKEMGKLENAHNKALKKLSVTVSKFDELHDLSASLLTEVEKLQSQVQERDKEISFLRQEVTRCTNDILLASQTKKNSDEMIELFEWLRTATSRVDLMGSSPKDMKEDDDHECRELIQNQIASLLSELEDLRHVAESRNEMLQAEKSKVQELARKGESLETALRQKETQLNLLEEAPTSSGIRGVEQLENNWVLPGPSTSSQVRSLRKSNNDQVAIAIEDDPAISSILEDEDEDKVHGFKSLTTSRMVPRFTRPVSDMVDGLWVSCDRALMRQPALRLAIILYWALLHSLLAAFVV